MRTSSALAALWLVTGCGGDELGDAQGQLVVHVTTDAPLPSSSETARDSLQPTPLFDSLRVDLLQPGADDPCDDCTREFHLTRELVESGEASFGFLAPPGREGYRARLRMFRLADRSEDAPPPDGTIDVTVSLPPVAAEGKRHVSVLLPTDAVAQPVGWPDGIDPAEGVPPPGLVGSWPGARRIPCSGTPPAGMVCIPGGAYWFGNPRVPQSPLGDPEIGQRLVVLSPFWLDAHEVTVGAFRSFAKIYGYNGALWSGTTDGKLDPHCPTGARCYDWCNYTRLPGPRDDQPMNCAEAQEVVRYCPFLGADLPTEAQLEYAASGLTGSFYPWGDDEPECEDAVFARGGFGDQEKTNGDCRAPTELGGTLAVGGEGRARDRVEGTSGGDVLDLAGNLAEWTAGTYQTMAEPCWSRPGIHVDPICEEISPSFGEGKRIVGGGWSHQPAEMRAASRARLSTNIFGGKGTLGIHGADVGFRCALPAEPVLP